MCGAENTNKMEMNLYMQDVSQHYVIKDNKQCHLLIFHLKTV